jgi:3-isopropylmalate dehydrogenase
VNARIVLLPGDGIGPEVVDAASAVLQRVAERSGHSFVFVEELIGGAALREDYPALPRETLRACQDADAVLLGAVGHPDFDYLPPSGRPESGLLALRRGLGVFANLRPARAWRGLEGASPLKPDVLRGTDMVVVRELAGGLYYGEPRGLRADGQSAVNTLAYSRDEVSRIARVAFDLARTRRRSVVSVDKANVLEVSRLWRDVVNEVARDYPDVSLSHEYVDAAAMKLALTPSAFDVVLTENMFGDILSDEAGAICGSLGLLPSASLGPWSGLFEPCTVRAGPDRSQSREPDWRDSVRRDAAFGRPRAANRSAGCCGCRRTRDRVRSPDRRSHIAGCHSIGTAEMTLRSVEL